MYLCDSVNVAAWSRDSNEWIGERNGALVNEQDLGASNADYTDKHELGHAVSRVSATSADLMGHKSPSMKARALKLAKAV